jgi:DNA-binding MarR family transcriptional regulator
MAKKQAAARASAANGLAPGGLRSRKSRSRIPNIGLGLLLRGADMSFNRLLREELSRHHITFSQYQHLRHLWRSDGLMQTELSRRIGIETASSTAVIDQLEKRALIRRRRDAADRRRIIVTLTAAGRALEEPLDSCAVAVNARARRGIPDAEIAVLFETLQQIIGNLRSELPGTGPDGSRLSQKGASRPSAIA